MRKDLFSDDFAVGDDVFELSAMIDRLVEDRVGVDGFLAAVTSALGRRTEAHIHGAVFRCVPGESPVRSYLAPSDVTLATKDVDVHVKPELPASAFKFVRQRLVHALRQITQYDRSVHSGTTDEQLRVLLSGLGSDEENRRIREELGIARARGLVVAAIAGAGSRPCDALQAAKNLARDDDPLVTQVGDKLAVVLPARPTHRFGVPKGLAVGIGESVPPERLRDSWQGATTSLRFSQPSQNPSGPYTDFDAVVVDIRNVGAFRVLAENLTQDDVRQLADVQVIQRLTETAPDDTLRVLEAVAATDSIRQAAKLVFLHHNTVAQRVEVVEEQLGYSVREHYGRTRLMVGLTLHRLCSSPVDC